MTRSAVLRRGVHSAHPMTPRRHLPALFLLFVGSGCAALIYEIVWFQLLQLVIGSSSISLGILLGTFMGGMCLGSLLLPRLISARRHPLLVYGMLELAIGVFALWILVSMPLVGGVYTAWAGEGMGGVIFRAVIAGICLLPPTMLMGATLPAISRWVKSTPDGVAWLVFFYGGNIGGGVIRSIAAGGETGPAGSPWRVFFRGRTAGGGGSATPRRGFVNRARMKWRTRKGRGGRAQQRRFPNRHVPGTPQDLRSGRAVRPDRGEA